MIAESVRSLDLYLSIYPPCLLQLEHRPSGVPAKFPNSMCLHSPNEVCRESLSLGSVLLVLLPPFRSSSFWSAAMAKPLLHFYRHDRSAEQTQPREDDMKCERCEGLMQALFEPMWSGAWRCLNCGHATDSVMEANRRQMRLLSSPVEHEESAPEASQDVITPFAA